MHASSIIARNPDTKVNEIDGLVVILDLQGGRLLELNETGSHIWMMLSTPQSMRDVCAALVDEYDVESDEVVRGVFPFMGDLVAVGALRLLEPDPSR